MCIEIGRNRHVCESLVRWQEFQFAIKLLTSTGADARRHRGTSANVEKGKKPNLGKKRNLNHSVFGFRSNAAHFLLR